MKDHTQNIEWIKITLARIEAGLSGGMTKLGQSLINIENQNAMVCGKMKWRKIGIIGIWSAFGSTVGLAVVGVVVFLLKYHHIHP